MTLTFSEAVTVDTTNGTPYVVLDIGGQPRNVRYSGDGTSAAAQPFSYTVLLGDRDTDGISVLANSLALDGGAIQATDDSADAALAHAAMTFANHNVDTEITLVSNLNQPEAAARVTISATQSAEIRLSLGGNRQFDINAITLDVKTPSDTLNVTVEVTGALSGDGTYTYTGSAPAAGLQTFTLSGLPALHFGTAINYGPRPVAPYVRIRGEGEGSIELAGTDGRTSDPGRVDGLDFHSSTSGLKPKVGLLGHVGAIPDIVYAEVISSPENGSAYAAGERIDLLVVFTDWVDFPEGTVLPFWLGNGAEHRREAHFFAEWKGSLNALYFSYTVQPGDTDTDGIYIGENPFGDNAGIDFRSEESPAIPAHLTLPANQLPADQSVDGSRSRQCKEVLCSTLSVGAKTVAGGLIVGYSHIFPITRVPYVPFGALSAPSFEYGTGEHALVEIKVEDNLLFYVGDPDVSDETVFATGLNVDFTPGVSESLTSRLAFSLSDEVLAWNEAPYFTSGGRGFLWRYSGQAWVEDDEIDVKLIELATASFDEASYAKTEGDSFDVTVSLDEAFAQTTVTLPITVTANGGAMEADYSGIPENLIFAPGDTAKTFTVIVVDDEEDDDGESLTLSFAESHIRSGGAHEEVIITLTDNDDPEVEVSFAADSYTAAEGVTATITIELSADPERTLIIPLVKTDQGDTTADDYTGVPDEVTFNSGQMSMSFTFTATQDTVDDDDESVRLSFGPMPDLRVTPGTTNEATVSITDDDDPFVQVQFSQDSYTAPEGGTVSVSVTLSADPERQVVIPLVKTHQGETTTGDYSGVPNQVTFNSGEMSMSFTFTAIQDEVDDDDESVRLNFGPMPDPRVSPGTTDETTVNITDDDDPIVTVMFARASYRVLEGDKVTVGVTLSADPERTVIIPITATAQNDTTAADYSVTQSSVTFNEGETSKPIEFTAAADTDEDDGDSVLLAFGSMPDARVSAGTPSQTTVSIFADCGDVDIWCASLSFNLTDFGSERLNVNQIDTLDFHYDGVDYQLINIRVIQNGHHGGVDVNVELPFGVPERTKWSMDFRNLNSGRGSEQFEILTEDWRDWTLHVSTVSGGDTLTAALHFSEARYTGQAWWWFFGRDIDHLRRVWQPGQLYKLRLVEDPRSERPPQPLNPPTYLRTRGVVNTNQVYLSWLAPQTRDDQVPPVDSYKVQWKESSGSWDTPADVSETTTGPTNGVESHFLDGLTPGTEYNIRVIATDSAGDSEPSNEITYTMPADAHFSVSNTPAEGAPHIDGTPEAGQTLSAVTTGITDDDGLNEVVFQYRWLADDAEIDGATGSTYTLTSSEEGRAITVRLDFTDDAGNDETLTSAPAVVTAAGLQLRSAKVDGSTLTLTYDEDLDNSVFPPEAAFAVNVNGDSRTPMGVAVGQSNVVLLLSQAVEAADTVTVDYTAPDGTGGIQDILSRKADSFSGQAVTNNTAEDPLTATIHDEPSSHDGQTAFTFELRFSETPKPDFSYTTVRDHTLTVTGGAVTYVRRLEPGKNVRWEITVTPGSNADVAIALNSTTDCSAQGATCTEDGRKLTGGLQLVVPGPNTPATGAPTISGTAQVGETLTASTSGIQDGDGLDDAAFAYQWLADGAVIAGANSSTYTLISDDEGRTIRVRVTFTDDEGHEESLTSDPTAAATPLPNTPAAGAPTITGAAQVGETLTASTTGISDGDGIDDVTFTYQWLAGDTEINGATASTYTLVAADAGKAVKVRVSFTDDAGNYEALTSAATAAVATPPNTPGHGRSHHQRDAPGGRDSDRRHHRHFRRRRPGQRCLRLPVAGRRLQYKRRHGFHLHSCCRRRGQDHQGEGFLHRRRGQQRGADQRGKRARWHRSRTPQRRAPPPSAVRHG